MPHETTKKIVFLILVRGRLFLLNIKSMPHLTVSGK